MESIRSIRVSIGVCTLLIWCFLESPQFLLALQGSSHMKWCPLSYQHILNKSDPGYPCANHRSQLNMTTLLILWNGLSLRCYTVIPGYLLGIGSLTPWIPRSLYERILISSLLYKVAIQSALHIHWCRTHRLGCGTHWLYFPKESICRSG